MRDTLPLNTRYARAMRSWSMDFSTRIRIRRYARSMARQGEVHAAYGWASVVGYQADIKPLIDRHAPWLNSDAISYRREMSRPTVNGYFVK